QVSFFDDEDTRINVLKTLSYDEQNWEKEVWEDLWIDCLIDLYLNNPKMWLPQWAPWHQIRSQEIESQHKRAYENLKRDYKKLYRYLQKKKGITDGEMTIILRIFVRRNVVALSLYSQTPPLKLENELHPYKQMYPLHLIQTQ